MYSTAGSGPGRLPRPPTGRVSVHRHAAAVAGSDALEAAPARVRQGGTSGWAEPMWVSLPLARSITL
jgi:hypothetical protein